MGKGDELVKKAKGKIPKVEVILDEAWADLSLSDDFIRTNFGEALRLIDERATEIYFCYERKALEFAAHGWLERRRNRIRDELDELSALLQERGWEAFKERATALFMDFAKLVQQLEKDLGNMRKARGGRTFELAAARLLQTTCIPCEKPKGKEVQQRLEHIDLVVPNVATALNQPARTIFLTLKRTLRERWKQEVPAAQGRQCWLLTLDPNISEVKADDIHKKGLTAYVLDTVAAQLQQSGKIWMRSLNKLPADLRQVLG